MPAAEDLGARSDLSTPWCVRVVAILHIADRLAAGITDIAPLADAAGCDADALQRMLRHLVGNGVFEEPAPDRFALPAAATPIQVRQSGAGGTMAEVEPRSGDQHRALVRVTLG